MSSALKVFLYNMAYMYRPIQSYKLNVEDILPVMTWGQNFGCDWHTELAADWNRNDLTWKSPYTSPVDSYTGMSGDSQVYVLLCMGPILINNGPSIAPCGKLTNL